MGRFDMITIEVTEVPFLDSSTREIMIRFEREGEPTLSFGDQLSDGKPIITLDVSPQHIADTFELALKSPRGILGGVRLFVIAPLAQHDLETLYDWLRNLLRYTFEKLCAEMAADNADRMVQHCLKSL